MALALDSWFPKAQFLKLGEGFRTKHDCGGGTILKVNRDERGYHAWCFRCNDVGWAPAPAEALADRLERLGKLQAADTIAQQSDLPEPRVYDMAGWPDKSRLWLLKAGLSGRDAGELGAYYHPPSDRVVLPCFRPGTGHCEFWQARATDGRQPKYLAPSVNKSKVVPRYGHSSTVTLTEDILSAYKVGQVGEGWCLLGTRISTHCLDLLVQRDCAVNVWLDPDGAGYSGATKVLAALRAAGLHARRVLSERDPKLLHREKIKELL